MVPILNPSLILWLCCKKENPFQKPVSGLLGLTLENELSKETHLLIKQGFTGKGPQAESRRIREPRRTAPPHGLLSQVLW